MALAPRPTTTFRSLLQGSALYTAGTIIPRLGLFLLLPVYTLGMGPAEFGRFSLMLSLANLLAIVFRLGLDGALMRLHYDVSPEHRGRLYWSLASVTAIVGLAIGVVVVTIGGPLFEAAFDGIAVVPYGVLALAIAATTALQYVPITRFRVTERPDRVLAFGVGVFLSGAVVTLWLVLVRQAGAVGGLLGQLAAGIATVVVAVAVLARQRPGFSVDLATQGLRFGLPLVPHSIAAWVLNLSDRWLIALLIAGTTAAQVSVGIYTLGYQLGQVVALVALSLNAAWVPFFYARGTGPHGPGLLRELTTLSIGGLAILGVVVSVLAPEAVAVLAPSSWGSEAPTANLVTPLVALASLLQGVYLMAVSPLFLQRRTAILPVITIASGAINVGLNLVLIPTIGIAGAAVSTVAGYAALALITIWYAGKGYDVRLDGPRLGAIFGAAVVAVGLSRLLAPPGLVPSALAHLVLAAAFAAVSLPILRGPWQVARALVPRSSPT